jgi:hypothetical protein
MTVSLTPARTRGEAIWSALRATLYGNLGINQCVLKPEIQRLESSSSTSRSACAQFSASKAGSKLRFSAL